MVVTISYKSWFDGLGRTRVHMGAAISMNVINFFLNIALIFGKWGFPRLGVDRLGHRVDDQLATSASRS